MQPIEYTYGEYCKRMIHIECIATLLIFTVFIILPIYLLLFVSQRFISTFLMIFGVCAFIYYIRPTVRSRKKMIAAYPETTVIFKVDEYGIYVHRVMLDLTDEYLTWSNSLLTDIVQPFSYLPMIKGKSITTGCYISWKTIKRVYFHTFIVSKQYGFPRYHGPFLRICEKKKKNGGGLVVNLEGVSSLSMIPGHRISRRHLCKAIRYFSGGEGVLSYEREYKY